MELGDYIEFTQVHGEGPGYRQKSTGYFLRPCRYCDFGTVLCWAYNCYGMVTYLLVPIKDLERS